MAECCFSPIHFHRELKLSRIVGRRRLPRIGVELVHGGHVVLVREIEHVDNKVQVHTFTKVDPPRDAQVVEYSPRLKSGITTQRAIQQEERVRRSQLRRS